MFRLSQRLGGVIIKKTCISSIKIALPITPLRLCDLIHTTNYRLDASDKDKPTPCENASRKTPKSPECKPKSKRQPCSNMPPDCQKIPPLDDCKKQNLLDGCPKPECPWDDGRKRNYRNLLLLGLLLAALAAALIAYMSYMPPAKKKRKRKAIVKTRRRAVVEKMPPTSDTIPKDVPYLVIGGGTAAFAAFRSIKSTDPTAKILLVSSESHHPYMRPPLSKEMWMTEDKQMLQDLEFTQWNGKVRSLFYEPEDFYTNITQLISNPNGGVSIARGWRIDKIDVIEKTAYLEDGAAIKYGKCLIATGAKPRSLPLIENIDEEILDRINVFRSIDDFICLRENLLEAKSIAIVGGGFLGTELSCAIARFGAKNKLEVMQICKENGVLSKVLPEYLSLWTSGRVAEEGVELISNARVMEAVPDGEQVQLTLSNDMKVTVDEVLVCIGMEPNTQIAHDSLLEVDRKHGGLIVNAELQARTDLWVAGDVASFYDVTMERRRRLEHHDNAVVQGRTAGENMCGAAKPYAHQSMYWSDVGKKVGFEAIGVVNSKLPTVGVFVKPNEKASTSGEGEDVTKQTDGQEEDIPAECEKFTTKEQIEERRNRIAKAREASSLEKDNENFAKGIVFYLKDDIVVGMVMWNVFHRMSIARQVLADKRKYEDLNEVAKLFNIHED